MTQRFDFINSTLNNLKEEHLLRFLRCFEKPQNCQSRVNGKDIFLFSSSNYLSLATAPHVISAAQEALSLFGLGSGGSRLTTGNNSLHLALEKTLATFVGYESCLLFNSGYHANLGLLGAVCSPNSIIFSDEKNHASIIDGCRLSRAQIITYKHNDMSDLETKLKAHPSKLRLVVSDGVFSMDGDIANLPEICRLGQKYDVLTVIDDAHGFGVLGKSGRGIIEFFDSTYLPDILVGTLSKAIAAEGGFVATSANISSFLQNKARSFIFSTSLGPAVLGGALAVLTNSKKMQQQVTSLQSNIQYMSTLLFQQGLITQEIQTAIIPIQIGDESKALQCAEDLYAAGIYIPAIRYPSVAKNKAILRLTLMSDHSHEQMDFAGEMLAKVIKNN